MKDLIVWVVHSPAGTVGLVAAGVAFSAEKGSPLHRKAGVVFTVAMLMMLISGFVAALLKESTDDMFLSAIIIYTAFTAWLTAHHKDNETGLLEYLALAWIIIVAIVAFLNNAKSQQGGFVNIYLFWTSFAVICTIGDIRNLHHHGLPSVQRIVRHVWRIGFSLVWAALALTDKVVKMLGANVKEMSTERLLPIIAIPVVLIFTVTAFSIVNVLFFSRKKFIGHQG